MEEAVERREKRLPLLLVVVRCSDGFGPEDVKEPCNLLIGLWFLHGKDTILHVGTRQAYFVDNLCSFC